MTEVARYEVALSFAGEQRSYVNEVAQALLMEGVPLFFDDYEEASLWGENLHEHLEKVYSEAARFVVMFVSKDYEKRVWPTHERRSAFAGEMAGKVKILPVRFDDTEIPGLNPNVNYVNALTKTPQDLAGVIVKKLTLVGWSRSARTSPTISTSPRAGSSVDTSIDVLLQDESPVARADVLLLSPNGTYVSAETDASGVLSTVVPAGPRVTAWVAHPDHPAAIARDLDPVRKLRIQLGFSPSTGSLIIRDGTGQIPGLSGRLNPILDTQSRTYLYADNISLNGLSLQPYSFEIGLAFSLEDAAGTIMIVTVMDMAGRSALLEYWHP